MTTTYDAVLSARYWSTERLAGCPLDDEEKEEAAVLCLGKAPAISRAYAAWETHWLDQFLEGCGRRVGLEIGCGVGRLTVDLARRFARLCATDLSAEMVFRAGRRLARREIGNVDFLIGRCAEIPLPTASVDAAVCLGVIEHVPTSEWEAMVAEVGRVLRPGGVFVLETNNAESALLQGALSDNPFRTGRQQDNGYFCGLVSPIEVEAAAAGHGLVKTDQAANPFYSLLRHGLGADRAGGDPDRSTDAYRLIVALDRLALSPDVCRFTADQFLYRFVKP